MSPPRIAYRAEPAGAGLRRYAVTIDNRPAGTVTRRRGGWWRAETPAGRIVGSWHDTRAEAAGALATTSAE